MSASDTCAPDLESVSERFCQHAGELLQNGNPEGISNVQLGNVLAAATRLLARKTQEQAALPAPFGTQVDMVPTDVLVVVSAMLKAVDLQPFELAMWQSWSGWAAEASGF